LLDKKLERVGRVQIVALEDTEQGKIEEKTEEINEVEFFDEIEGFIELDNLEDWP
jgi:hypothetical protein